MAKISRNLLAAGYGSVLLICGACLYLYSMREPRLMDRAARIADASRWDRRWTSYEWITNHEVLFFRDNVPGHRIKNGWSLYKHDLNAESDVYLAALSGHADDSFGKHSSMVISPDGRRALWTDEEGLEFCCCDLDGRHFHRYTRGRDSNLQWMQDSATIVEYAMDGPLEHFAYGISRNIYVKGSPARFAVSRSFPVSRVPHITSRNHLLTCTGPGIDNNDTPARSADILEIPHPAAATVRHHIIMPITAEIWDPEFSPDGDKVAWTLVEKYRKLPAVAIWIRRFAPALIQEPGGRISIWLSRIDGTDMHELGYVPLKPDEFGLDLDDAPDDLKWSPDGKRLSFLQHDALYSVTAQ